MAKPTAPDDTTAAAGHQKRPYGRPELKMYGNLAQLTQAKGMQGLNTDGALASNNKTL